MANKKKERRTFIQMTSAERDADVAKYDAGVPFEQTRPLTARERARWERATRGPGRPPKPDSEKAVRVLISIDPALLARAHATARRRGDTLSGFIAELLRNASRNTKRQSRRGAA